jgi:hypothetical protein
MPNNPIIPPKTTGDAISNPVNEVKNSSAPSFTGGLREDIDPIAAAASGDVHVPELEDFDKIDPEAAAKVAAESTGKKLTREEQIEFIKNLDDDMMVVFAKRVQEHILEETQAKTKPKPKWVTDFSVLHEQNVFDLNTPIQAIDHQIPEYLDIKLKDGNFSPRWIQTSSKNLGTRRSQGWSYITQEDLAEGLKVEIEPDSSGHFVYIDTVAMKIPKAKLYSQLRSNYLRAIQLTQQSKLHERMKAAIEDEITNARDERGMPLGDAFNH